MKKTKYKISAAATWKLLNLFNEELLKICASEDSAVCFDLASEIPHSESYFYDRWHFTELGAELVAEKLAEFLKSQDFEK